MSDKKAIGLLETRGFAPLVQDADEAIKAANVDMVEWRMVGSGYVSFVLKGYVAAVRFSIEAGAQAASTGGEVVSELIIPRPVDELDQTFER